MHLVITAERFEETRDNFERAFHVLVLYHLHLNRQRFLWSTYDGVYAQAPAIKWNSQSPKSIGSISPFSFPVDGEVTKLLRTCYGEATAASSFLQ